MTAFSKHIGKAYHVSQRYNYKWTMNTISSNVLTETAKFKDELVNFKRDDRKIDPKSETEMFDCTDKDDLGMTSFLAHTIDNSDVIFFPIHFYNFETEFRNQFSILLASSANRCSEQDLGFKNNLILFNSIKAFLDIKFIRKNDFLELIFKCFYF